MPRSIREKKGKVRKIKKRRSHNTGVNNYIWRIWWSERNVHGGEKLISKKCECIDITNEDSQN